MAFKDVEYVPPAKPAVFQPAVVNKQESTNACELALQTYVPVFDPDEILKKVNLYGTPEQILQSILGDTPLDEQSANDLWASLSFGFIKRWNRELPPVADNIQTALCRLSYRVRIHRASFMNFGDELHFRGGSTTGETFGGYMYGGGR